MKVRLAYVVIDFLAFLIAAGFMSGAIWLIGKDEFGLSFGESVSILMIGFIVLQFKSAVDFIKEELSP